MKVRPFAVIRLMIRFAIELTLSVWRVAVLVLFPAKGYRPGIFRFPLRVTGDFQITLLANMITLTPGTLTVDVAEDRSYLLVHAIDAPDPDAARRDIAESFERLILEAFP